MPPSIPQHDQSFLLDLLELKNDLKPVGLLGYFDEGFRMVSYVKNKN